MQDDQQTVLNIVDLVVECILSKFVKLKQERKTVKIYILGKTVTVVIFLSKRLKKFDKSS